MVDIVINEPLIYHVNEYDGIIVSTNCYQSMRNGFQYEVAKSYPYTLESNYKTKYGDKNKLGTIIECHEENKPLFILAFNTFLYNFRATCNDFFDYESLENSIKLVNILYKGRHLATTIIGCTWFDGNADRTKVLSILNKNVKDFNLTVFDYKQESFGQITKKEYIKNLKGRYAKNKLAGKGRKKKRMQ